MTKEYSVFRGDMYSVGVILYAVTYGMFPYGDGIASGKVKGKSYEDIAAMLRKETLTFTVNGEETEFTVVEVEAQM